MSESESIPLPSELSKAVPTPPAGNPLAQYFRHTKISVELPSQGKFWPEGSLELSASGEIEVMPLTAKDEIILKSPEGLLSGSSVVEAIASCVPAIKNPWLMPAIDVDTVFIAIRIASFDHKLEITSNCPKCKEENEHELDLRNMLDNIPKGNIKNIQTINELTFEFVPYTFEFVNKQNIMKFEQERLARGMAEAATAEDVMKNEYFKNIFRELADHNTESIVTGIKRISMPGGHVVNDKAQITEFIQNADRETIKSIRAAIEGMTKAIALKPVNVQCQHCEHKYETTVEFNQSNFFE